MIRIVGLVALALVGCSSKQKTVSNTAPTEATAAKATPEGSAAPDDGNACYAQCLANGPDSSPMTAIDWPKTSESDKTSQCEMACADANMPDRQDP